ncbi:MAG: homocysteine S-methyltransferase family protein [Negativicutes bacterium]
MNKIHLADGAMGTMLQNMGLTPGESPDSWALRNPEAILTVHRGYVEAGAERLTSCTFGANRIKLSHYGLEKEVFALNAAAVKIARQAGGDRVRVGGNLGPTGKLIRPLGEMSFDAVFDVYAEQVVALTEAGVDYFIIQTMIDIQEMRAALLAAKQYGRVPVICQMTFESSGRTVTGTDPTTAAVTLESLGADMIGANCSLGPDQLLPVIEKMVAATALPVTLRPNAGMPVLQEGRTIFPLSPEQFAAWAPRIVDAGVTAIGGCCGTTPAHIAAVRDALRGLNPVEVASPLREAHCLTSRSSTVYFGAGFPIRIIGERINPTGRKAMAAELREGNLTTVKRDALAQQEAGAAILDVNAGVPGIDQPALMVRLVEELSQLVILPLSIDTTDPDTLEAGLRIYPGRALVNSVSAEPERLEKFLPIAKRYGAAVLCLPLAPGGLPANARERVDTVRRIIDAAMVAGLRRKDLLLDALTTTLAVNPAAATDVLETLRLYGAELGLPVSMGLSNVSHGLPRRDLMNAQFFAMAAAQGMSVPILNPLDPMMNDAISAVQALLGHDRQGLEYSRRFAAQGPQKPAAATGAQGGGPSPVEQLRQAVIQGEKEAVKGFVMAAIAEGHDAAYIIDNGLTEAMNRLGEDFGTGRCFLPQVLLAAEALKQGFQVLRAALPAEKTESLGKVMLATVAGDIHDLGKNIVAALLENNGFEIIDLGKDVPVAKIVAAAREHQPDIIGLCALMTTTLPQIDHSIAALKAAGIPARFMVGGAVLTPEYAKKAGADEYAADAVVAVALAKRLVKQAK